MNTKSTLFLGLMLLSVNVPVSAQDDFFEPPFEGNPQRREQIEALRIYKMTEFLDLTEEQAQAFFPKLKIFEDHLRAKQRKQMELVREINQKLKSTDFKPAETDVRRYAKQLADLEREIIQEKEKFISDCGPQLTSQQQLKFIVFENRFRQRLLQTLSGHGRQPMKPDRR